MSADGVTLSDRVLRSASFALLANVIQQSIGIVSMLILARLLSPQDYGIVAAAMLVIHFFDVFSETGINEYILSRPTLELDELHSAWTLRLLVRIGLALIVVVLGPFFADFFNQPELHLVLLVAAMIPVIDGLENPGLLLLRREFEYRSIALLLVSAKLAAFLVSLIIALVYQSYWALVVGSIVLSAFTAIFSYRIHPIKPEFTLSRVHGQWSFSSWSILRAILGFSRSKADNFLIGKFLGVTTLGVYSLSKTLATIPHEHLTQALTDIFTSSIGGSHERIDNAASSLSKIMTSVVSVMLPVSCGMYLVAEPLVDVLLGPSWVDAVAVIEALSLLTLTYSISMTITTTLIALGHIRIASYLDIVTLVFVLIVLVTALMLTHDMQMIALARTFCGVGVVLMFYGFISHVICMPHRQLLLSCLPALLSCTVMALVVYSLGQSVGTMGSLAQLLLMSLSGMLTYAVVLAVTVRYCRTLTPQLAFMYNTLARVVQRTLSSYRRRMRRGAV